MNPRRLIAYAAVLVVVAGIYAGLRWHQAQKEAEKEQAKEIFNFKKAEISGITLKRGTEEIQLTRQGAVWEITKPVKAKADKLAVDNLVQTLAQLKMQRNLGPGDFKTFGLEKPELVVLFTVKSKPYQLEVGQGAPGNAGFYVRKGKAPDILLINVGAKDALDRKLVALRDKTLLTFKPDEVKSLKIRTDKTEVDLEKDSAQAWHWVGRPDFRVRADRVRQFLRQLSEARITEFPPAPKDLKSVGLAPRAQIELSLTTSKQTQTLWLGAGTPTGVYAKLGNQVIQVMTGLPTEITQAVSNLEDRRLWSGPVMEAEVAVWGTPGKFWTAIRDKSGSFWKITGPNKAKLKKSAPEMEMALMNFQNLEYSSRLSGNPVPGKDAFSFEIFGQNGHQMLHLDELAGTADNVQVRVRSGKTIFGAVVPRKKYDQWREEMARLTMPPPKPVK